MNCDATPCMDIAAQLPHKLRKSRCRGWRLSIWYWERPDYNSCRLAQLRFRSKTKLDCFVSRRSQLGSTSDPRGGPSITDHAAKSGCDKSRCRIIRPASLGSSRELWELSGPVN
jgi:hypothetical protein